MSARAKIIMNAIEDGWSVTKINNTYTFSKKHYNLKEYLDPYFLGRFLQIYCK
jgi:transposase